MVLFGIWHRGTVLLVLFGCYHGVLLVLHRQVQAAQRRMNWEPPPSLWTPLAWLFTMALISLGWLPFRANSWGALHAMIVSLLSTASYGGHALPRSLYLLVAAVGIAYAVALTVIDALEKLAARGEDGAMGMMVRDRWTWLAPMYVAALVLVITMLHGQSGSSTAFLYRFF
jgi:D-alanyl-lipoteichoic acid acyltransferase DltB (MBOAT superfamily)